MLISISSYIRYISWAKQCRITFIHLNHKSSDLFILARFIGIKESFPLNSIVVLHCPRHFSRSCTSSSVHLNLFAFSKLFCTVCLLVFLTKVFTAAFVLKPVCLWYQSYATIFVWFLCHCACINPFLSRDKRANSPQVGWPVLWKRVSSASEPTRLQPALYIQNFVVG